MKTSAFIDRIVREAPSWTRPNILLEINYALDIIFDRPLRMMRIKDTSTGLDPVLTTVAGTFEYEINAAAIGEDAMFVRRAYTGLEEDPTCYDTDVYSSLETGANAKLLFKEDPGGTEYHVEAYKFPTKVVSETFPTTLPFPDQFIIRYLYDLVAGNIESMSHGKSVRLDRFYAEKLPELHGRLNEGESIVHESRERAY